MNFKRAGLIIVIVLVAAVYLLNKKDVTLAKQDGFELNKLSVHGAELKSVVHLNNPNLLSATIKKIHEEFYINRALIATLDAEINQGIPGMKETELPVSVRFNMDSSVASPALVEVKGEISFSNFASGGVIKVEQKANLPVQNL